MRTMNWTCYLYISLSIVYCLYASLFLTLPTSGPTAAAVCAVSTWHIEAAQICVRLNACLDALAETVLIGFTKS